MMIHDLVLALIS